MTGIRLETVHADAESVALAVKPDNTDEMETRAEVGRVITTVERDDVGSVGATADDYLRNVVVADEMLRALS